MKRQHLLIYAVAAAALLIGVAVFGSSGYVFSAAFLLLCPLMMIFMMGGMHGSGGHGSSGENAAEQHSGHGTPSGGTERQPEPPTGGSSR